MIPEAAVAMLACARIGAVHSVVFAGFSSNALKDRVIDAHTKVILTADEGFRAGKTVPLKKMVDEAIDHVSFVEKVFVFKRSHAHISMKHNRDFYVDDMIDQYRPYCPPETMDSEDPLFVLYTSGSTGKPKGLVHTTAGYITYASITHKYLFDYKQGDIYACVADIGWITGHSYIVYGPLANGATTVMFEGIPTYPDASRYWFVSFFFLLGVGNIPSQSDCNLFPNRDMVERLKINSFYTSPTAIRALMKLSNDFVTKHDLSSLRVLGTVGEPINPEVIPSPFSTSLLPFLPSSLPPSPFPTFLFLLFAIPTKLTA